jgi:hypothetical protein
MALLLYLDFFLLVVGSAAYQLLPVPGLPTDQLETISGKWLSFAQESRSDLGHSDSWARIEVRTEGKGPLQLEAPDIVSAKNRLTRVSASHIDRVELGPVDLGRAGYRLLCRCGRHEKRRQNQNHEEDSLHD